MRKLLALFLLGFISLSAQPVFASACTTTINTLLPVQNTPLTSAPVRNNFQAAANDINTLCSLVGSGGSGGGSSGGYSYEQILSSGTTITVAHVGTNVLLNSAASGGKSVFIPTATGSKQVVTVTDVVGTAGNAGQAATAVPASGSVVGNNQVYTNGGSITLYDSSSLLQWVSQ